MIVGFEALLIEALEPPQNRRRGDEFKSAEYQQLPDPKVKNLALTALLEQANFDS